MITLPNTPPDPVQRSGFIIMSRLVLFLVWLGFLAGGKPTAHGQLFTTSKRSGSTIAITSDGTKLIVLNPDSNSITLVDALSLTAIAEVGVGVQPRSVAVSPDDGTAYVVNQGSDSLSVVDISSRSLVQVVPLGDRPAGVVVSPDGRVVAIAELGDDRIRFLDAISLTTLSILPVGDRPVGLAIIPDGRRLLVTHLLNGGVTALDFQPYVTYLPLVSIGPPGSFSGPGVTTRDFGQTDQPVVIPTWPNVAPAPSVIVNAAGTRAYLPQTMANGLGDNTRFDTTVFPKVSVLDLDTNTHSTAEHISLSGVDRPVGLPWDAALAKGDTELWVVNSASNDLSVIAISNPTIPVRTAHIPLGDNPRGVVISPDGSTAYVNNTLAGTVSVIDTLAYTVTQVITVTQSPLPPAMLNGKQLFFSSARPDLAQARWISCNTCHVEGEHDGRTWLLQYTGEVPIGATPVITRNTTSLLGMIETYPLRWSAEWDESADSEFSVRFEQFGTGLIEGPMHPTLGPPNQGRSYDLDCLALFIDSLAVPDRTSILTEAAHRGRAVFESPDTGCLTCHPPPLYADLQTHDVGTADAYGEWFGPSIDTPTLRFLYDSAPYLHDGSAPTLLEVLTVKNPADEHGVTSNLTAGELADLVAFLLALPFQP